MRFVLICMSVAGFWGCGSTAQPVSIKFVEPQTQQAEIPTVSPEEENGEMPRLRDFWAPPPLVPDD